MKILEFLQDGNDKFSSTRLALLLWVIGLLVIWTMSSIHSEAFLEIPTSTITLVGILVSGKVVQKFGEEKTNLSASGDTTLPTPTKNG